MTELSSDVLVCVALGLLLGLSIGWWMSRRGYHRGVRELEAYLEGWEAGEREGEKRGRDEAHSAGPAAASARARGSLLRPVFEKLDQHRQAFLSLRTLSAATSCRLQKLLDVLTEVVLLYDAEGRLLYVNGKMRELAGHTEEEIGGAGSGEEEVLRSVGEFLSSSSNVGELVATSLAPDVAERGGADPEGLEVLVRVADLERRFFATPHLIRTRRDPQIQGLLVLLTDVEALEEVRRNAACRIALEHGQLAAELLAHRLRNPLNSAVLVLELIRRESAADGKVRKHLETIGGEISRLERTLQGFLDVMRRRDRVDESVDLVSVIETVSELLYPLARDRQIRVRQDLRVSTATLRGDRVEVLRAVLGPCLAALKEAAPGAELQFRLDSERREHLLLIESAGVPQGSIGLAVAEELTARNRGSLSYDDPSRPARLTYRFSAETGA